MTNEIFKDEIISDEQLGEVVGGNRRACYGDEKFF